MYIDIYSSVLFVLGGKYHDFNRQWIGIGVEMGLQSDQSFVGFYIYMLACNESELVLRWVYKVTKFYIHMLAGNESESVLRWVTSRWRQRKELECSGRGTDRGYYPPTSDKSDENYENI